MSEELTQLGVKAIRDGVAGGEFTAREVAEAFNANVAAAKDLNAFVVATPEKALEAAARVDADRAAGKPLGAMAGVPIGMKDLFATKGVQTTAASHILDHFIPEYESTVSQKLWNAGAGMLGYAEGSAAGTESYDDARWRPTGDLVEVLDGRVLFRGRSSEVINVGGVKVHPLPVEDRIVAVDGVAHARVFGRANRLTGAIVAAEIVLADGHDEDVVRAGVREAMADLPRAWHPRSITFVETIETQGNKTIRRTEA